MLVYVRADDWGRILCNVDQADISDHLCKRLEVREPPARPPACLVLQPLQPLGPAEGR
jgi:hypothetical protein